MSTKNTPQPEPLWPQGAPGALGSEPADIPTLTWYLPKNPNGAGMVVCPGGAYMGHADHEGKNVAEWLNTQGVTAVVLHYRLGMRYHHPAPLQDASHAIRTFRSRAKELGVDKNRIGVMGFSAGGHLAATLSNMYDAGDPKAADPIERESSRPTVSVLIYPVITMESPLTHEGSRLHLLGESATAEQIRALSHEHNVTADTPPTFLMHTVADTGVPVENSIHYGLALRKAGVPFEMHIYQEGSHGKGLAQDVAVLNSWPDRCRDWLRQQGF